MVMFVTREMTSFKFMHDNRNDIIVHTAQIQAFLLYKLDSSPAACGSFWPGGCRRLNNLSFKNKKISNLKLFSFLCV